MTELELVQRARSGDLEAMRSLYDRHSAQVYSLVRRLAGDDDLAADLAQDAWINAFEKLRGFRGDAAFGTWMHRIAVNTTLTRLRKASRRRYLEQGFDGSLTLGNADASPASLAADRVTLQRALDLLPTGYRTVLWLHDVEGYTHEEVGERLGIAPGTSKSQLAKARARLRSLLAGARAEVMDHDAS